MKTASNYVVTAVEESPDLRGQDILMARVAWPNYIEPNIWTVHTAK